MKTGKRSGSHEAPCVVLVLRRNDADEEGERGVDSMKPLVWYWFSGGMTWMKKGKEEWIA